MAVVEQPVVVRVAVGRLQLAGRAIDEHTELGRRDAVDDGLHTGTTAGLQGVGAEVGSGRRHQPRVRRERPGVEIILADTTEHVVVPRPAKQHVGIGGRAVAEITFQPIVAAKAVQHVASQSAVHPIAAVAPQQQVVAAVSGKHADPIAAASVQPRQIHCRDLGIESRPDTGIQRRVVDSGGQQRVRRREADHVVPRRAADRELFDQRRAVRLQNVDRPNDIRVRARFVIEPRLASIRDDRRRRPLAEQDHVVGRRADDLQDVGRVVISHIGHVVRDRRVAAVTVDLVIARRRAGPEDERVDPFAAEDRVRTRLTFESVIARSAPHQVIAATAEELIRAAVTEDRVVAPGRRGRGVRRVARPVQAVTQDVVIAAAAGQQFASDVASDRVVPFFAEQLIADRRAAGREREQLVVVGSAEQALPRLRVAVAGIAEQPVVAAVAKDKVDAVVAVQHVVADTAAHAVVAVASRHIDIIARTGVDEVRAATAVDRVGVRAAVDRIVVVLTEDRISAVVDVPVARSEDVHHERQPCRERIAADQHVIAATTRDRIVAQSRRDEIIAVAAVDDVVANSGEQIVVVVAATDRVVAVAPLNRVRSGPAADRVAAVRARVEDLEAAPRTACEQHLSAVTENEVIPLRRENRVAAATAEYRVGSASHVDGVRSGTAGLERLGLHEQSGIEHKSPAIADHDVRAAAVRHRIRSVTRDDRIVAAAGRDRIKSAVDRAAADGRSHVRAAESQRAEIAKHQVRAAAGVDDIRVAAADENFARRIAGQRVATFARLGRDRRHGTVREGHDRHVADQNVRAAVAREAVVPHVAGQPIRVRIAGQHVVAAAAGDVFDAGLRAGHVHAGRQVDRDVRGPRRVIQQVIRAAVPFDESADPLQSREHERIVAAAAAQILDARESRELPRLGDRTGVDPSHVVRHCRRIVRQVNPVAVTGRRGRRTGNQADDQLPCIQAAERRTNAERERVVGRTALQFLDRAEREFGIRFRPVHEAGVVRRDGPGRGRVLSDQFVMDRRSADEVLDAHEPIDARRLSRLPIDHRRAADAVQRIIQRVPSAAAIDRPFDARRHADGVDELERLVERSAGDVLEPGEGIRQVDVAAVERGDVPSIRGRSVGESGDDQRVRFVAAVDADLAGRRAADQHAVDRDDRADVRVHVPRVAVEHDFIRRRDRRAAADRQVVSRVDRHILAAAAGDDRHAVADDDVLSRCGRVEHGQRDMSAADSFVDRQRGRRPNAHVAG